MTDGKENRRQILDHLLSGKPGHMHCMGICGVGMAGVAHMMSKAGWHVSGCDAVSGNLTEWLTGGGIKVDIGHSCEHVDELLARGEPASLLVVRSTAVPLTHPEIRHAIDAGIHVVQRGELLAVLSAKHTCVAVCGAHGKTTTTCFTTRLLQQLEADPNWCIGGKCNALGAVARAAENSNLLVVEADESDGTLALYEPAVTVITNIDLDHLEHFRDEAELLACFETVARNTRKGIAFCIDDKRAGMVAQLHQNRLGYGFSEKAELRATALQSKAGSIAFNVVFRGTDAGRFELPVPGKHNVLNALGAVAAAILLGYDLRNCLQKLSFATELPGRRFEIVTSLPEKNIRIVSDYAHHPTEIRALIDMAKQQGANRLLAIFQPHRYSRTKALAKEFAQAFDGVDELILTPVYAASEPPINGGHITDLYGQFRLMRPELLTVLAFSLSEAWEYLRRNIRQGDLVLIIGAGDVVKIAGWAKHAGEELCYEKGCMLPVEGARIEADANMGAWCSYGSGGRADWRIEVESEEALKEILRQAASLNLPIHILGSGANTLVADTGLNGIALRLCHKSFARFARFGDEVELGCGWLGSLLLNRLDKEGLAGLEFLDSVPGQLGGWLAMNAGAHGGEIGSSVVWIRCLNFDGTTVILNREQLKFGYRQCGGLTNRIALKVRLRLETRDPEAIKGQRLQFRQRRVAVSGMRTAGSVFRNPPEKSSGRILELAGCKNLNIGGAVVTDIHANIVAAGKGATASDLLALMTEMRRRALQMDNVALEPEVKLLGLTATGISLICAE